MKYCYNKSLKLREKNSIENERELIWDNLSFRKEEIVRIY